VFIRFTGNGWLLLLGLRLVTEMGVPFLGALFGLGFGWCFLGLFFGWLWGCGLAAVVSGVGLLAGESGSKDAGSFAGMR
jgi:hypothetical protein